MVQIPLQEIVDRSTNPLARKTWESSLESLAERIPDDAMEICEDGELLPGTRPPHGRPDPDGCSQASAPSKGRTLMTASQRACIASAPWWIHGHCRHTDVTDLCVQMMESLLRNKHRYWR